MKRFFNISFEILKPLLGIGILYWFFQKQMIDFTLIKKSLELKTLVLCTLLLWLNILVCAKRWQKILSAARIKIKTVTAIDYTFLGIFFNFILPGGIGGDVVKTVVINRSQSEQKWLAATSTLLDRFLGLYSLKLLALIAFFFNREIIRENLFLKQILLFLIFFVSAPFFLFFFRKSRIIKKFMIHFSFSLQLLGQLLVQSIFSHLVIVLFFFLMINHIYSPVDFNKCLMAVTLGLIGAAIPITPAGVGIGQASFFFFFSLFLGNESNVGATVISIFQIYLLVLSSLATFIFYMTKRMPFFGR